METKRAGCLSTNTVNWLQRGQQQSVQDNRRTPFEPVVCLNLTSQVNWSRNALTGLRKLLTASCINAAKEKQLTHFHGRLSAECSCGRLQTGAAATAAALHQPPALNAFFFFSIFLTND